MSLSTGEEILRCFISSEDFNEIFDAFESAVGHSIKDIELYKQLFWNKSLTPDEVRLFGEKLAFDFPDLAYDVFFWLAKVFEATQASRDNFEMAFHYYQKAAHADPTRIDPYIIASECYEKDLNIPPLANLIEFVKSGMASVSDPTILLRKLAHLFELAGDPVEAERWRRKAETSESQRGEAAAE